LTAVEFNNVTLTLGGRDILSGVDLAIPENAFIGVLGPNGAGKTTMMRAVLGLLRPAAGTIGILGAPATCGNSSVGYMPQTRGTVSTAGLSGWDFVAAAVDGHRWGLPILNAAGRRDVQRVLGLVGASELARRPLGELSGGERQRLLLAQSLLGSPRLLLLDEPLISLDPHYQRAMVELVSGLQRELGLTVLFSAHELNPLLGVLDQVLYLGGGQAALGTVDEVITGPVLSRLYGSDIEVVHLKGRIFVMSGAHEIERDDHQHDRGHGHAGGHAHHV
jgi:zinc/manganese transport system ATP-binding protein